MKLWLIVVVGKLFKFVLFIDSFWVRDYNSSKCWYRLYLLKFFFKEGGLNVVWDCLSKEEFWILNVECDIFCIYYESKGNKFIGG